MMKTMTVISEFDLRCREALGDFMAIVESDIRSAHGEPNTRPVLSDYPDYVYAAAVIGEDADFKEYEEEIEAQRRALKEP
jgi:hypothetical protein